MKCLDKETKVQCTGLVPGETQEEHGLDSPQRAQHLRASVLQTPTRVVRQWIKWPPATNKSVWQQSDEDLCEIVQMTAKGDADRRLLTMTTIIVSYASERFGPIETAGSRKPYNKNCRLTKIQQLHQELRSLKRQYKVASGEERQSLAELQEILRTKLLTIRRAEWHRRRAKKRAKKQASFIANSFSFTK